MSKQFEAIKTRIADHAHAKGLIIFCIKLFDKHDALSGYYKGDVIVTYWGNDTPVFVDNIYN